MIHRGRLRGRLHRWKKNSDDATRQEKQRIYIGSLSLYIYIYIICIYIYISNLFNVGSTESKGVGKEFTVDTSFQETV